MPTENAYEHASALNRFPNSYGKSIAACCGHLIARHAEILVPRFRKAGDDLLRRLSRYFHARMHDVSPGMHARPASRCFLEADPLRQHNSERVVNPAHFSLRLAIRDDMAHYGIHRPHDFDLQPAACFPRSAFAPVHLPINVGKFVPTPPVGENLPGPLPAGLGGDALLKSE